MIKHERLILEKLTENPMLSQGELAAMLNLARSSVSVYISHLMQMGYIRGRGYLIEDHNTVYVIGTAGIDYRTIVNETLLLDSAHTAIMDDNDLLISYGGIGKNIADSLHRIGLSVSCICAVGSDTSGKELLEDCRQIGVDVSDALIVPGQKSSTYLEIRSLNKKRILINSANVKLQETLTPEYLQSKAHKLRHALAIVIEDSLSIQSMQYISSNYIQIPIFMVCSKPTRAARYVTFMNQFHGLIASLEIAWAILGEHGDAPVQSALVADIIRQISAKVCGPVLLCYGASEFAYSDGTRIWLGSYENPSARASIYSHYRDTVAAGFIHCLLDESCGEDLIRYVCACRQIVAQSEFIVSHQLCPERIAAVLQSIQCDIYPVID